MCVGVSVCVLVCERDVHMGVGRYEEVDGTKQGLEKDGIKTKHSKTVGV